MDIGSFEIAQNTAVDFHPAPALGVKSLGFTLEFRVEGLTDYTLPQT